MKNRKTGGIDWRKFSLGCLIMTVVSLGITTLGFISWVSSPGVDMRATPPPYVSVAVLASLLFFALTVSGLAKGMQKVIKKTEG